MGTAKLSQRTIVNIQEKANFIWAIADKLEGTYKPYEYGNVILPMCVIKRFSYTLAGTKGKVIETNKNLDSRGIMVKDGFLRAASGYDFYNVSPFTFEGLLSDAENIADNFRSYFNHFSTNVIDVIEKFEFDKEITKLSNNGILYNVIAEFCSKKAYIAQIVRTFDVELYKTYIFTELLFKLLPKNAHEKVYLNGKLALEHNMLSESFFGAIVLEPTAEDKTLKGEKRGTGKQVEEKKDLLGNIIDKINIMYHGNFTDAYKVIVETIYDSMQKEAKKLTKQAKNSDVNMFTQNIFPKIFEKIAQACYVEQMDAFAKLFEDPSFYGRVMEEMGQAMYFNLKNGQ